MPLVPVTVTVTDPVLVKVQDSVEAPEPPVTVAGVMVQAVLSEASTTLPAKLSKGLTVIVELPGELTATLTVEGLALIVKSWTVKVTVTWWDRVPLVPVTVTEYEPAEPLHERVELPDPPVTVAELKEQVSPVLGETEEERLTELVNPLTGEMVIRSVPDAPASIVTAGEAAAIVKSGTATMYATVAVCDSDPLIPVTVTVKDPEEVNVQESVDVPAPVILVGASVHAALLEERLTTPLKPPTAATVIVDVPAWFTLTLTLVGLALIVKSCTVKETVAVCDRLPLVPVTVTVTLPVVVKVHDKVEEPDPGIEVGDNVQAALPEDKLTVPLNPPSGVTVIDDVPAWLTSTLTLVGLAAIVKSCTVRDTVA